ncbi:non-canonical purine NTP pyrophosphatase, rdgB/HAM1 family [Pyrolobus fumarii 1A]|uniref:dITP/XTP pyrophosphatase n=1 Tax=Pyrolobus fumarii (strain DSM 11204 / 1A) TaxID=694429 RepID=G0ED08_PYRF1|nr:RdgB/HAM1 family non-canonical purine NTP pyrophosphatase [Pyrolobus fumarii]AEM38567.1 non-canonical purine NTP pyrophosphatase, rdgB/HAM1 family [Pyrolobus fumarii 1A]
MRLRLYFVTSNWGKFEEARMVMKECGVELVMEPRVPKVEVQSLDVSEVARWAAYTAYLATGRPVVVEDTGLYIDALGGFPGAMAAHVYKTIGVEGILKLMENVENRRARFVTSVVAVIPPHIVEARGTVEGVITRESRGSGGFGFDPIFQPLGADKTFAEMSIEEKNRYSHRARAFRALCEQLKRLGLV